MVDPTKIGIYAELINWCRIVHEISVFYVGLLLVGFVLKFFSGFSFAVGRLMTFPEKQHLRQLIRDLPPKNLDRVVQIFCRGKQVERHSCSEVYVDLENEVNICYYFFAIVLISPSSWFLSSQWAYCRTKQHCGDCTSTLKQLKMLRDFARCNASW